MITALPLFLANMTAAGNPDVNPVALIIVCVIGMGIILIWGQVEEKR